MEPTTSQKNVSSAVSRFFARRPPLATAAGIGLLASIGFSALLTFGDRDAVKAKLGLGGISKPAPALSSTNALPPLPKP